VASQLVLPSSDGTFVHWTSTQANFWSVLAANSGMGNGTDLVTRASGVAANGLVVPTGFSVAGISAITSVTFSVVWEDSSFKNDGDFQLSLTAAGSPFGTIAGISSLQTTSSTFSTVTATGSLTINDSTVADWANFAINLFTGISGSDEVGNFFGLGITVNYTPSGGSGLPWWCKDQLSGGMQTLGLSL
jgi:hypothetical protein